MDGSDPGKTAQTSPDDKGIPTPVDVPFVPTQGQIDLVFEFRGRPLTLGYHHTGDATWYSVNDIHRTVIAELPMARQVRIRVAGRPGYKITLDGIVLDGNPQTAVPEGADGADVFFGPINGLHCSDRPYSHLCFTAIARPSVATLPTLIGDPLVILVPTQCVC